jgi:phage-related protein
VVNLTLELEVVFATPATISFPVKVNPLGDGYEQLGAIGMKDSFTNYNVTSKYLPLVESNSLINQLDNYRGIQAFDWTPDASTREPKTFVCKRWELELTNEFTRKFSATFEEVIK